MTEEEWQDIPGHPGYQASTRGRVRSLDRELMVRSSARCAYPRIHRGRVLIPYLNRDGYLQVNLGRGVRRKVHVLVAEVFYGPRPVGAEACHNNGNPLDNRNTNLRWGTASSNRMDSVVHGTHGQRRKLRCGRRHDLVSPNLSLWGIRNGRRKCLACARARNALRGHPEANMQVESDLRYAEIMGTTTLDTPGPGSIRWGGGRR